MTLTVAAPLGFHPVLCAGGDQPQSGGLLSAERTRWLALRLRLLGRVHGDLWQRRDGRYCARADPDGVPRRVSGFEANNLSADFTNAFVQGQWLSTPTEYNSQIVLPPLNINSNAMTITMWINPNEAQAYTNGLLYCRGAGTVGRIGLWPRQRQRRLELHLGH